MPRLGLLLALVSTTAGCLIADPHEHPDLKEVYVEVAAVTTMDLRRVAFPLSAKDEPAAFVALRSFEVGALEGRQKLGRLLGQWPRGADLGSEPALDTSAYPATDPPVLLVSAAVLQARHESGCYVGHSAYAGDDLDTGGREVIHHLRLLVVNRESEVVVLRPEDVSVEVEGLGSLELLAVADQDGAKLDALRVAPGQEGMARLFFTSSQVPPVLALRWRVRLAPPPGARADARGAGGPAGSAGSSRDTWSFEARLQRRYVVSPGVVSALEDAVARRLELPAPLLRPRDPWREPRMEPVGR